MSVGDPAPELNNAARFNVLRKDHPRVTKGPVLAQIGGRPAADAEVPTVVVTATRYPVDAATVGSSISVITAEELQQQQTRFVSDILREVPGVAVNRSGAAVSVSGSIGFIGLVVPHLLRPLVGAEPGRLLWVSALGGALLLTATDIVVRLLEPGPEIRIGVLTALFGAPFFLVLLLRLRREAP